MSGLTDNIIVQKVSNKIKELLQSHNQSSSAHNTLFSNKADVNHTHDSYVNPTIVDNVTTNDATKVLSAKQGKWLNDNKASSSHTHGNLQNNGQVGSTIQASKNVVTDSSGKITTEDKPTIPTKVSDLTNDSGFLTSHQDISGKANSADLATVAISGSYNDLKNKPTLSSLGGAVTITKQATAESGYSATYVINQGGTALSPKINIPKDFLVKSGEIKSATTANNPIQGLAVGDKYLDFTVNTIDDSETASHIYINVKDLVDAYNADNSTLELGTGNVFKVKDGGITLTKLASALQTTINGKANSADLATVATSGSYNDLSNKPTIPSGSSTATDIKMNGTQSAGSSAKFAKADHVHPVDTSRAPATHNHTKSQITDFPSLSTVATSGSYNDLSNKPTIDSSISSSSTNAIQNKVVYSAINSLTGDNIKLASNSNESISSALSLKASSSDARLSDARTPLFNKIPATSSNIVDLNNYQTGGFYFIDNDSNSPYIIHCPKSNGTNTPYSDNKSFFLIVEQWTGSSYATKQTLTYYNTNETYVRTKASTNWLPWKKAINNHDSVGGTNILKNTQAFVGTNNDSNGVLSGSYKSCIIRRINNASGSTYNDITWTIPSGEHHHGERYTLSFWAKGSGSVIVYNYGSTNYIKAKVIACTNGGTSDTQFNDYNDGNCTFALTNTWKRYFVTWELNPTSNSSNLDTVNKLIILRTTAGSDIYYAGAMYERGEVPHDWSPAPDERITTTYAQHANSSETAGYFKLLTIRMRDNYKDANIQFTINRRSNEGASTDIDIAFEYYLSGSNRYYRIKYFYYNGSPINAYIKQTQNNIADGIFDFYIYAPAWSNTSVNNIITNDIYMNKNAMSIMPKSEFISSLPSGCTQATLNPYKGSDAGTGLTKSNGALSVTYGTASNTACQGNDTRIISAVNSAVKIEWKQGTTSASSRVNPANISISKGASVNVYCINAMGISLSGQVIFVINGTAYSKTLSGGMASQTMNTVGTFAVEVYYYDSNYACLGSAGAKVTVT